MNPSVSPQLWVNNREGLIFLALVRQPDKDIPILVLTFIPDQ